MPNVVRGERMGGLMSYLAGPGRRNEHTEPHVVAGDPAIMAWHAEDELGAQGAAAIARYLDRPRKAFDVEVSGGHVWHCSLSLRAEEGLQTDEKWGEIARDFVGAMGFDDNDDTKAPCRWVAVRHGLSTNGNDHIHLVVNLVREDGTKASTHRDFYRSQKTARELETKHGLEPLESAGTDRATRGYHPAEREAQARARAHGKYEAARGTGVRWEGLDRAGRSERIVAETPATQPRADLARLVRACATASADEAEFVRRLRRASVLARPRFADGRPDVVTGYSVAMRPVAGERPIWYGGGHLGRDLALPRLRAEWPDTPQGASTAAAEWVAARRGRRPVAVGREAVEPDPELWARYSQEIGQLRDRLRAVPVQDTETWAKVARQTAGAFAAWSTATEAVPGPLAATADALARSAQTRRTPTQSRGTPTPVAGAAMLLMMAARGGQGTVAQAILLRQLANLAKALYDMHRAAGDARRAAEVATAIRTQLAQVADRLPAAPGAPQSTPSSGPSLAPTAAVPGSPVPARLGPHRSRQATQPGRNPGAER